MSSSTWTLSPVIYDYLLQHSLREPEVLLQLRQETAGLPGAVMQISPEQGQFMALLIQLCQAKKTLEVGTFTGYSALVVALALPATGKVVTCDIDAKVTEIAQRYWQQAGVAERIELHIGPAMDTLDQLIANDEAESFDFAFIDADKNHYLDYYERSLRLLRPGGLLAIDNVLWSGGVADATNQESSTRAIRALNERVYHDSRVTISMLPISDGLTLAIKL